MKRLRHFLDVNKRNFIINYPLLSGAILGIIASPLILWIIPNDKQLLLVAILILSAIILFIIYKKNDTIIS
jgi:hypothetical protein